MQAVAARGLLSCRIVTDVTTVAIWHLFWLLKFSCNALTSWSECLPGAGGTVLAAHHVITPICHELI